MKLTFWWEAMIFVLCYLLVWNATLCSGVLLYHDNDYYFNNDSPVVRTEEGLVQGRQDKTDAGTFYYAFQGIPYAEPPVGELRFQPPIRKGKWNNILQTTKDKNACAQGLPYYVIKQSEDCLYINVYVPKVSEDKLLPAMVWIYGGTFIYGTSSYESYAPDYFLDENVIFVSFNYRLGIFGFLSTEDLICPGNMGLKDQVLALEWVHRNIKHFGGDPQQVTLFGQSAGAVSVSYLLQSQLTKGFYKAAIMESGSSLCPWALDRTPKNKSFEITGSKVNNSTELLRKLRKMDYRILQLKSLKLLKDTVEAPLISLPFAPVIEPYHKGAIVYNKSELLLSTGSFQRVPLIIGLNAIEAASYLSWIPAFIADLVLMTKNKAPVDLTTNQHYRTIANRKIFNYYNNKSAMQFFSDDQFNRPIRKMAIDMANYTNVYFYKFSYGGTLGLPRAHARNNIRTYSKPGHGEELGYLFKSTSKFSSEVTENDVAIRKKMVKLWTNFAKYNNPTPYQDLIFQNVIWPTVDKRAKNLRYLDININLRLKMNPFKKNMKFYDKIYAKYGEPPYDTY